MDDLRLTGSLNGVTFAVRLTPRASENEIAGIQDGVLKVRLTAPPVEGAANAALIELIADRLKVRKSAVSIISGDKARSKVVQVIGLSREQVKTRLSE